MSVRRFPSPLRFIWLLTSLPGLLAFTASMCRGADDPDAESRAGWQKLSDYGTGIVVWESNRSGRWRIWRRGIDGSDYRQLTPEESGRDQFCPHLSPDGTRLVYLSCPAGQDPNKGGHRD
jgi:Tol biopolymer transport system component